MFKNDFEKVDCNCLKDLYHLIISCKFGFVNIMSEPRTMMGMRVKEKMDCNM